jgi:excisionase family DNA binding protein
MNAHSHQPQRLKQALNNVRRALEELESAMVEFEEELSGRSSVRPQERRGLDLLSIPEVCQELGMGKSWLYRKLRSGEIPSVKLGRNIKVKRSSLEEYLENQTVQQAQDLANLVTDQARGAVGQVAGQVGQVAQGEQRIMGRAVDVGRAAEGLAGTAEEEPDVTKAAMRKAEALGVDLSKVQGSGIGGCITIKDVVGAAS